MITIRKATQKQVITAIKSGEFSEVLNIRDIARQNAADIFRAVSSGAVPLIWYDLPPVRCQSGAVSVMWYAQHRSTKLADHLQLSCMEIKDGRIIPTSDRQYSALDNSDFLEFFRDLPREVHVNYLEQLLAALFLVPLVLLPFYGLNRLLNGLYVHFRLGFWNQFQLFSSN